MARDCKWILVLMLCAGCTSADLLLTNGRVFTADPARPWASTIAIRGDRIVALHAMPAKRTIDLHGAVAVPGINDAHLHQPFGVVATPLDLQNAASADEVLKAVAAAPGPRIEATLPLRMFDESTLTRDAVDRIANGRIIVLQNPAGHAALVSGKGWLYETELWEYLRAIDESASESALRASMQHFAGEAIRYGITSVQSMPAAHPDRLIALAAETPLRWRFMEIELGSVPEAPRWPTKYIADGTPIERDAALREQYSDRPDTRGAMNFTDAQVQRAVEIAAHSDQQLLFHAAGELPLDKFLAAMEAIPIDWPAKRVRIEHGDFIAEHLDEAKRLGCVIVQNPAHFMSPEIMRSRYGASRVRNFQMLRSLIEARMPVAIGSDGPLNPWLNIMFATMHPTNVAEAITREQAVTAYTRGSAYAEFAERQTGMIAPGMLADIAVLSQDVFNVAAGDLPKTESVLTIIGGRIVYEKP